MSNTDETTQDADSNANPSVPEIWASTGTTFEITDTKLYVPAVTLSTEDDNELLEQLKRGFSWTIKWNKYRLIQHLLKSIDYLFCHLKMKMIERLFQSIVHQK